MVSGGREARAVYARPFAVEGNPPKIAIVVTGLGLSKEATEAAISKLPPDVSLSFSPYTNNLDTWVKRARAAGHEVLIDLPLEPPNFPVHDAGPLAILSRHGPVDAVAHLDAILAKTTSYVGVAAGLRSPVTTKEQWAPVLRDLKNRGLLFVGDGLVGVSATDTPASLSVTLVADETPFRVAIDVRLSRLLAAAQRDGSALAYVSARPVTMERLLAWVGTFPQKGVALAPISAVVRTAAAH
ncbi:divergent polysaccharide deacetylase family protein [Telmatospirillum siberiense]|uniref:divergent polysaccharide deacetylase family protein n=1 Tax=Telmatospirillum siberiense TaxID=382514 RepID=UPI003B838A9C